jgi:hypothetical protein
MTFVGVGLLAACAPAAPAAPSTPLPKTVPEGRNTMTLKSLLASLTVASALVAAIPAAANYESSVVIEDKTSDDMPCLAVDLRQHRRTPPECADLPHFKASFLNRVWRFNGAVDSFQNTDDHVLSITVESIEGLPKRYRNQDDDLLDQDAYVLMSENIRVFSPENELISHDELEHADYVRVRARVLRPRQWRENEDGDVVPTLRAKRIYVKNWIGDYGDEEEPVVDEPECHPEEEPELLKAGVRAANGC